jgi:hypothetical protein
MQTGGTSRAAKPFWRRASRSSALGSKTDGSRRLLRLRIGGSSPSAFVIGDLFAAYEQRRPACTGGHGTAPYEQNTQQSPGSGLSLSPQPPQV